MGRRESDGEGAPQQKRLGRARGWEARAAKRAEGPPGSDGEARGSQRGGAVRSPRDSSLLGTKGKLREIRRLNRGAKSYSNVEKAGRKKNISPT